MQDSATVTKIHCICDLVKVALRKEKKFILHIFSKVVF